MKIPSNNQWTQTNEGDIAGVLHTASQVCLDTPGKVTSTKKAVAIASSESDPDYGYTLALLYFTNKYIAVTDDEIFEGSVSGFTQTASFSPATTLASDAVLFRDASDTQLIVSTANDFARWNGAASIDYTAAPTSLTSGVPHPLAVFADQLVVGDGNYVRLYDISYVQTQALILRPEYVVTTIRTKGDYVYIGTKNVNGGEAKIFIWDGNSELFNYEIGVGCSWVFSITDYGSTVAAVVSSGMLGYINGNTFDRLAAFPVYYSPHSVWQDSTGLQLNGKVFNRGMATIGDTIYINIDGRTASGFIPEMKSGLWVFDPSVGLYHRSYTSTDRVVIDNTLSVSNDVIRTSADHKLVTGDGVYFTSVAGIAGLDTNVTYYVTVVSSNSFKLSLTRTGIDNGNYVTLLGTATTDTLCYYPNTDYGTLESTSGAILPTVQEDAIPPLLASEVLFSARTETPLGSTEYVLCAFADQWNVSRLETQRIYSSNVTQSWKDVYAFIDGLKVSSERMILKAQRKSDRKPILLTGVWSSPTVLNTNDTDYSSAWAEIQLGDELVFTMGLGQGRTAHVASIEKSATVYQITLDEPLGVVNTTSVFYTTSFQKITSFSSEANLNDYVYSTLMLNASSWLKIALETRGFANSVNMLEVSNEVHKKPQ